MAELNYTKGEWKVVNRPRNTLTVVMGNIPVAAMYPIEEEKANAQLIASAPKMYEALKETLTAYDKLGDIQESHLAHAIGYSVRQALAKVEDK